MAEPKIRLTASTPPVLAMRVVGRRRVVYEDIYYNVLTRSWVAFGVAVLSLFLLANSVFALLYMAQPGSITNMRPWSFEDAFYFSVQTMATIGYGVMAPATRFGHMIVTLEAVSGVFGMALVTGITFAKFARPTARVLFCEKAVIGRRNGEPYLMFRMANWRGNQIVEAQLRVVLLVSEVTREGERLRRQIDLKLERERTALFTFTWTALHRIDAESPFYGDDALARLEARQAELFLSLNGIDETMAQLIHARHRYALSDVVTGARFADVFLLLEDGTRVLDYTHFHETVAQG